MTASLPTDRGYVEMVTKSPGLFDIRVFSLMTSTGPEALFAIHSDVQEEKLNLSLPLTSNGARTFTYEVAEVFWDSGSSILHVRTPSQVDGASLIS